MKKVLILCFILLTFKIHIHINRLINTEVTIFICSFNGWTIAYIFSDINMDLEIGMKILKEDYLRRPSCCFFIIFPFRLFSTFMDIKDYKIILNILSKLEINKYYLSPVRFKLYNTSCV